MEEKNKTKFVFTLANLFDKKNRLFLIGIAGIILIFLSDFIFTNNSTSKADTAKASVVQVQQDTDLYVQNLEERLTKMIVQINGAGNASVMITLETAGETIYARNEKNNTETQTAESGVTSRKSVYESEYTIIDDGTSDVPIVEAQLLPDIKGVAVVCEGGDDVIVVAKVTELVSVVLGLSTNRICVAK